jgi:hypothetical protein
VHFKTGGLQNSYFLSSPWNKTDARDQQEINGQLAKPRQANAKQGLCKRECSNNQQVGQQHQKFSNLSKADTKSLFVDEEMS